MPGAEFKWVETELVDKFYGDGLNGVRVGIPQGGALSCFISNLVLHTADEATMLAPGEGNQLYMRFCDDMILLNTDKQECERSFDRFQAAVTDLKLLIHPAKAFTQYSKEFWEAKSKVVYKWDSTSNDKSNVPWLSYVGYQINYNGFTRIRKRSFEKELAKQKTECNSVLNALKQGEVHINFISKKSKKEQLFALEKRLINMSVGRVKLHQPNKLHFLCWTNGFKSIDPSLSSFKQLKILDRNRSLQLYRVKKQLQELTRPSTDLYLPLRPTHKKHYFGAPFSYHQFLVKKVW
jgi:hypothetical protein